MFEKKKKTGESGSKAMFYFRWIFGQLAVMGIFAILVFIVSIILGPELISNALEYEYTGFVIVLLVLPVLSTALGISQKWAMQNYLGRKIKGWIIAGMVGSVLSVFVIAIVGMVLSYLFPEPEIIGLPGLLLFALYFLPLVLIPAVAQGLVLRHHFGKWYVYSYMSSLSGYLLLMVILMGALLFRLMGTLMFVVLPAWILIGIFDNEKEEALSQIQEDRYKFD